MPVQQLGCWTGTPPPINNTPADQPVGSVVDKVTVHPYHGDKQDLQVRFVTAIDLLANDPRPEDAFGNADVLRIHVGRHRVMYEISDQQEVRVSVIHLGRLR
ncbi:type II toxin-antitoxin system RelE/ParE family toxin [Streptomyces sp. NPDC093269]|uniref:type II toxin-antitoxin system RelE family toxin n=1 Tax=Streptomyces sp. NPDC093269 TaxID=3366038 RepID=UPI00383006BB